MFQNIDEIKQHINVSKNLDFNILKPYIEVALNDKILPLIGKEIITKLESDSVVMNKKTDIYFLIKRATANYAVAFSIPFLKMHLSNTGANTLNDSKMERSNWWDVRDYGLNAVAVADRALNDAIFELQQSDWKENLPILNAVQGTLFASPKEFSAIYPIGDSYEIFLKLIPLMENVWNIFLSETISNCLLSDIKNNPRALNLLRRVVAYHTLSEAVILQSFTFTHSGIIIQWEQLPWQKSQLFSEDYLLKLPEFFTKKANDYMNLLLSFLRKNASDFPCFKDKQLTERKIIAKKSGLYF